MSASTRCLCLLVCFNLNGVLTSTCGFTNFFETWYQKEHEIANFSYILDIKDGSDVSVSLNILFEVCENNYLQTRCNCILSKPANEPVSVDDCMGPKQVCSFTNRSLGSVKIQISYPLSLPLSVMRLSLRSRNSVYETARMIRLHVSSNPPTSFRPLDAKSQTTKTAEREGDATHSMNGQSNPPSTGYEENGLEQKTSALFDVIVCTFSFNYCPIENRSRSAVKITDYDDLNDETVNDNDYGKMYKRHKSKYNRWYRLILKEVPEYIQSILITPGLGLLLWNIVAINLYLRAGNVNMSCTTRHQVTHQLQCTFPDSVDVVSAIAVYFTPDPGSERRVVNCVQLEDLECSYERGFKCEILTSKYAEITVPESFQQISGTFRCQIPGLSTGDIRSCHWPAVMEIPDDILQSAASFSPSQYLENVTKEVENEDGTVAVIVSVVVVLASLLIVLVVGITLVRKRMEGLKKHKLEKLNFGVKFQERASEHTPRLRDLRKKTGRSKEPSFAPLAEKHDGK